VVDAEIDSRGFRKDIQGRDQVVKQVSDHFGVFVVSLSKEMDRSLSLGGRRLRRLRVGR
jgi:hypothetical protein